MTKKRIFTFLVMLAMLLTMLPFSAFAADDSRSYVIDLCVNGSGEVQADAGDILTVTMILKRTDSTDVADMYAMQDEIRYDPAFFELVEGSAMMADGIEVTDIDLIDGHRAFYVNYLSMGGGEGWEAETTIGSFQIKVLGSTGSSALTHENYLVSVKDGSNSYVVSANDLLVVVSSDCTVHFDSMGGSAVPDQSVLFGEKLQEPEKPTREGYTFTGWYSDIYLKHLWNFDEDTVKENMTLYAGWQIGTAAGGFPWWILLLILVAGVGIGVYVYYKKAAARTQQ